MRLLRRTIVTSDLACVEDKQGKQNKFGRLEECEV